MESYGTLNMGCTSSIERSDGDMQPRRMLGVNELLTTSTQPASVAKPPTGINSGPQSGRPTSNTQIQTPNPGHNFLDQNDYLLPNQASAPGIQHLPRSIFPPANQQYQDPWEARGSETFYRFEHFHNLDTRRHGLQQIPDLQGGTGLRVRMNAVKKTTTVTKACSICLDQFSGPDSVERNFPYSCERFCGQVICIACLKDWFIDSCKNESKMPPRCCCTVPLSAVSHLLSKDQIDLYKSKFEEWRTPDRFYCPVPTCSTFIPPRLIKEGSRQNQIKQTSSEYSPPTKNENLNPGENQIPSFSLHEQYFPKKDVEVKFTASASPISIALTTTLCPKCSVSICTRCRQIQHPDAPCPQTDLDPLLATQLEKWKIKRCPKCRVGVRRMFGCSHIECRCGAHFCFSCLQPMKKCDGQCEDDDDFSDDYDMSDDDLDSEDVDALMAMNGTELDLGVEPYNPTVDTWSCTHSFKPIYKFDGYLSNGRILNPKNQNDSSLDCQVCWKVLSPHLPPTNTGNLGYNVEIVTSSTGISNQPGWAPTTVDGEPAWMCVGKHLVCYGCPKDTTLDAKTSKYRCECSAFCLKCAKVVEGETMQLDEGGENKEIDLAYDCDCGMIVCGACKTRLEDELDES